MQESQPSPRHSSPDSTSASPSTSTPASPEATSAPTPPDVDLPDDYPKGSVVYPKGTPVGFETENGKSKLILLTPHSPDQVIQYYLQSMPSDAWEEVRARKMTGLGRSATYVQASRSGQGAKITASRSQGDQLDPQLRADFGTTRVDVFLFDEPELQVEVPVPPNAVFGEWELVGGNRKRSMYYLRGNKESVLNFYRQELPKLGWTNLEATQTSQYYALIAEQSKHRLEVIIRHGPSPMIGLEAGELWIQILLHPTAG